MFLLLEIEEYSFYLVVKDKCVVQTSLFKECYGINSLDRKQGQVKENKLW